MLFERFDDRGLSQYSYAVGCETSGEIAVVDPRRDVDVYLEFAAARNLEIRYVAETHIHADFASGARELAERAGAELWLSKYDAGELYDVKFPHHELSDGGALQVGNVRLVAVHTPGHTPEHLSYLVYDLNRSKDVPELMLTGDFLFVGSLGRPDLLGEDAKRSLAERMYDSVRRKLADLPDGLEVHPGHGAGSMCGAGMSARPMSTLGFERVANAYLRSDLGREQFVETLLANVPPFPPYYRRMKVLNSSGARLLGTLPGRQPIELRRFRHLVETGHLVIDLRDQLAFGAGHVPGALGIGAGTDLSTWAAWVVPYDEPITLVAANAQQVDAAVRSLVRVGLDEIHGYLEGGMERWTAAGYPVKETPQWSVEELYERLASREPPNVLDVRSDAEWRAAHIEGAAHLMGGELKDRLNEVPQNGPLAVICASGYRSTVAASILEQAGFRQVANVSGGMNAWKRAGFPAVGNAP